MKAYVLVEIRPGDILDVVKSMNKLDAVIEAHMTFGPYDAVAVVDAKDISHLGKILAKEIQPIPGVLDTLTCLTTDG